MGDFMIEAGIMFEFHSKIQHCISIHSRAASVYPGLSK